MSLVVFGDVEVNGAVAFVGKSVGEDFLYQLFLFDDVPRRLWFNAGRKHVEQLHGSMIGVGIMLCNLHGLKLFESRFLSNLVIAIVCIVFKMPHIGDVSHVAHLVTQVLQVAKHDVEGDGRSCMTQMRVAIYGGSAYIHAHAGGV